MDNKIAGKPLATLKTMQGGSVEDDGIISWSWASWVSSDIIVILFPAPSKRDHLKSIVKENIVNLDLICLSNFFTLFTLFYLTIAICNL